MSVMTPEQLRQMRNAPGTGPAVPLQMAPPAMQRDAVMDQLAPPTASAQPRAGVSSGSAPTPGGASPFARGGTVTALPTGGRAEAIGNLGAGVGSQIASNALKQGAKTAAAKTAAQQVGGQAAKTAASKLTSFGGGAAGAATSAGIGLATGLIADKLKVKEDVPTFGGSNAEYLDELGRRFEGTGGGVASNAVRYAGYGAAAGPIGMGIGAAAGALKGALSKNAKSAYTDFKVEDAANAIKAQYKKELGRDASDAEVEAQLVGQGWNPTGGDRWVGEKNLNSVMDQIRASPEARAFADTGKSQIEREALMSQLGGEPTATNDLAGRGGAEDVPGSAPAGPLGTGTAPGSAPAAPGGGGEGVPIGDTSTWDTDQYAAPQFVPKNFGPAPPGFDADKWNDPNHQTPKYAVSRILNQYGGTPDGVAQAMPDLIKAYPGATFNGKDKVTIPGVGTIDVVRAAGKGGEGLQWIPEGEGGGGEAAGGGASKAPVSVTGEPGDGGDLLAQLQAEIDRITKGNAPRSQVMSQLGAEA